MSPRHDSRHGHVEREGEQHTLDRRRVGRASGGLWTASQRWAVILRPLNQSGDRALEEPSPMVVRSAGGIEDASPSVRRRNWARRLICRLAIVLSVIVLLLLAAGLRMAPHSGFYPIPAGFRAYSVYDIRHILRTGHEIRLSEKHNVTSYSSGIYLGTDDILRHKVDASVMLLLGLRPRDLQPYYHFGLWSPLVAFPLAVLALYYALCRCNNRKARSVDAVALVAFSVLGSFMMIDVTFHGETNTATGWTFMAVAMYGLVRIREA